MSSVSPRSLQLLHDIVGDVEDTEYSDLHGDLTTNGKAETRRVENMNGEVQPDFNDTLNFFEKLEKENGSVGHNGDVRLNGYINTEHVKNGVEEDTLQGIAEESADESYTLTEEVSETTVDTSTLDNDTSSGNVISKKHGRSKKSYNYKRPTKTSSVRDNSTDRDSMSDHRETMSDSGRIGRRQRKLNKRAQYQEFRQLGLEPLETAEVRLEKKYKELESLMSGQFVEQKKALSINHLQQMELLRQQYAIASHGLPPSGILIPRSLPSQHRTNGYYRHGGKNKENRSHPASEDEAYGTIRTLQASKVSNRRSRARSARTRPLSATRHNQSRSTSRDRRDKTPDGNDRNDDKVQRKARSRSNSGSRSSSRSPRRAATETHLENTDNELVKEWIKRKNKEYRRQKAEERRKKKLERKEKIEKQIEREEKFKDSHLIVNAWMKQKQREAYRKQRQERRELREKVIAKEQSRVHNVSGIHGWGVDRPLSAPSPITTDRNKIRVQRPGTTVAEVRANEEKKALQSSVLNEDDPGHQEIPQPPMTKYVYRRPVLGKVRLRTKQGPEETKPAPPVKKPLEKPLSKEEIEKKQRMSYDDWLQQKRKEDQEKKREMQRKKELAQSNPEYETPVPELVKTGENNVLRGKHIPGKSGRSSARPEYVSKIISQEERDRIREMAREKKRFGQSVQEEVDTTYDERSESPEHAIDRVAKNVVTYVLKSLSDEEGEDDLFEDTDEVEHEGLSSLSILGSRAPLSSKTRPMSASSARIPTPQVSKSPRRPVSAQPVRNQPSEQSFDGCIPFPDDIGAPPNVLKVQKKLFSHRMSSEDEAEAIQDNTSNKAAMAEDDTPQDVEQKDLGEQEETEQEQGQRIEYDETRESNISSKKHVSFCEETTVFDDSEGYEELEAWSDGCADENFDVEKIRKMFIEGSLEQRQNTEGVLEQEVVEQGKKEDLEQGKEEDVVDQIPESRMEAEEHMQETQGQTEGVLDAMENEEEDIAEELENMEEGQEPGSDAVFLTTDPEEESMGQTSV